MSYVCPYCFREHDEPDASCCGERGHCEPVIDADDQYAAVCESPSALWREVGGDWDYCRVRLHGEDMPGDKALVYLAHAIRAGETNMDVLRCIAGDVLDAMAECAKEAA
ncbi:MAG: hypothetical protein J5J04_13040 [Anaerolineae bacterium]|nr:hypothetical protein [Anaerolineae bacterium]